MRKIVDYKLVKSVSKQYAEKEVLELIAKDYQPYGSPLCDNGGFIQAMVKYEEQENGAYLKNDGTSLTTDHPYNPQKILAAVRQAEAQERKQRMESDSYKNMFGHLDKK